jgi:NAD(P)-dependent dehydrogenase (short-subunit alcohol dehydrogenase family)
MSTISAAFRPHRPVIKVSAKEIRTMVTGNARHERAGTKLQGKVALITGGTTGIGLAAAKRFVAEGAYVFITGRRQAELDAAVKDIGHDVTGVRSDASKLADLDRLFAIIRETKGTLDVVLANAGGGEFVPLGAITEEHFDTTFDINVKGVLFTVQKALPLLRDGSSVILTGSTTGTMGTAAFSVYSATKAAVRNFARTWILDLKERKIRVNVLSPGPIQTPGLNGVFPNAEVARAGKAQMVEQIPLGRIGDADEVASAAVFLASDDSSFTNGAELFVDGGYAQV